MKIILRLYRVHDLDLITLYRDKTFSLKNAMIRILEAYVRKENIYIMPPEPSNSLGDKPLKTVTMFLNLDENKDQDVIAWLKNVKPGYRNSAVKNLTRGYLKYPITYIYQNDVENDFDKIVRKEENDSYKCAQIKAKANKIPFSKKEKQEEIFADIMKEEKKDDAKFIENMDEDDAADLTLNDVFEKVEEKDKEMRENSDADSDSDMFDMFENMMNSF